MYIISCGSKGYVAENSYTPYKSFAKNFESYISALMAAGQGYSFEIVHIGNN